MLRKKLFCRRRRRWRRWRVPQTYVFRRSGNVAIKRYEIGVHEVDAIAVNSEPR